MASEVEAREELVKGARYAGWPPDQFAVLVDAYGDAIRDAAETELAEAARPLQELLTKAERWMHAREQFEASDATFDEAWAEDQAYRQVEDELAACVRALTSSATPKGDADAG